MSIVISFKTEKKNKKSKKECEINHATTQTKRS